MICGVKTPTHLLIRRALEEYPLPPSIKQYALEHLTENDIKTTLNIEDTSEENFLFLTKITRDWISGTTYEKQQFGTRSARLFIFDADSVLFEKDSCTIHIGEFVRTLEDAIRSKTLSSVGVVARTILHTKPNESFNGTPEELEKTELERTIRIGFFKLPKYTDGETADKVLSDLWIDFFVLQRFSPKFQQSFTDLTEAFVQRLGKEMLRYENLTGEKLKETLCFETIQISLVSIHKDIKMFFVKDVRTRACANIMEHNNKISLQSFTASRNALVSLLTRALSALKSESDRHSGTIL